MKSLKITCANCTHEFEILLKEHKRQIKNGRVGFFCSRTCAAIKSNRDNPRPGNPENLQADNRRDEYTQFRWFVNRGNYRGKRRRKYGCDLTVEFLKELWDQQNGICPFTGWKLVLPQDSSYAWSEKNPANASLDRIDNSKGYMRGNVRFISVMANLARQTFTDEQVRNFCKAVVNNEMATS